LEKVSLQDYLDYTSKRDSVEIGGKTIPLKPIKVSRLEPRKDELGILYGTVWSFPKRGRWGTHRSDYRGNWPPQIPRILIETYTKRGSVVLDPMVGSGTTCIEAVLLGRKCIGVDVNKQSLILAWHRLYSLAKHISPTDPIEPIRDVQLYVGDARNLTKVSSDSVDLVATHPPYWRTLRYTSGLPNDISMERNLRKYLDSISAVAGEAYRALRPNGVFAILLGDSRKKKHYVPVSMYALKKILERGFILMEEVVKIQHRIKDTQVYWERFDRDFLMIKHEKLYIFRKPSYVGEERKYRYSTMMKRL
jgi:DNA modification methylase